MATTDLPRNKGARTGEILISAEPAAVEVALIRIAPRLPRLSMIIFATALPNSPPTEKMDVTAEKIASDIGMQEGRL